MSYLHLQKILQIISAGGKLALVNVVGFFLVFLFTSSLGGLAMDKKLLNKSKWSKCSFFLLLIWGF